MSPSILLDIPEAISRQIYLRWLDLKHVVRVDSACCSRDMRSRFLAVTYCHSLAVSAHSHHFDKNLKAMLRWAVLRGSKLDGVCISGETDRTWQLVTKFLVQTGSSVRWIHGIKRVGSNGFQQKLLEVAKLCPNVQKLTLTGDHRETISWDGCFVALASILPSLTDLALCNVPLLSETLGIALQQCAGLEKLSIWACTQAITEEIALPTLRSLTINSIHMTDAVMIAIGQRCSKLEALKVFLPLVLETEHRVTDVGVSAVLQGSPLLRDTDVEYAVGISDELRVELARRGNFSRLVFTKWRGMGDELAREILRVSPNLVALSCQWRCGWLTDATLAVCAEHCPLLEAIALADCPLVTDSGVRYLVSRLGNTLREVNLVTLGCPGLSDDSVMAVVEHCPHLQQFACIPEPGRAAAAKLSECCVAFERKAAEKFHRRLCLVGYECVEGLFVFFACQLVSTLIQMWYGAEFPRHVVGWALFFVICKVRNRT
jgi:hypothetical protein